MKQFDDQDQNPLQEIQSERGRATALADALGISAQAVHQWKRVPARRVLDVERVTGISRHLWRPDIFGDPPNDARSAQTAAA